MMIVTVRYRNWRGEVRLRRLTPVIIWFGSTEHHPEAQWLLRAYDEEDPARKVKDFTLLGMLEWRTPNVPNPIQDQPEPTPNTGRPIWELVREDAMQRYGVTCRHCGEGFRSHASATRFCSDRCLFLSNVTPVEPSSCWLWRGRRNEYARVERKSGSQVMATHFAYEMFWGPIEADAVIRHTCDEPGCVNPFHLVQGTPQQNSQDMVDSRRQAHGERHGSAKLTEDAVLQIRADEEATDAELAARYDVSRRTIRLVRTRQTWRLVDADMKERDRVGRERYGTPLQAGNGRDALVDAYQEALDLVVYLRQAIEERDRR